MRMTYLALGAGATALAVVACAPMDTATHSEVKRGTGANAGAHAVKLIGAWVNSGAPEKATFTYKGKDGRVYAADFATDILPLFTRPNVWMEGAPACSSCHFANSENSSHEMDLSSYAGIMRGADTVSKPPGVSILGESKSGARDFNWGHSKLKGRLRNNRMPPGMPFMMDESNRDGPTLDVNGQQVRAVKLIGAWIKAGAPETAKFGPYGATFAANVLPLFTESGAWHHDAPACASCHFATSENSAHELDLSSYAGMMKGADVVSKPPGVSIFGESKPGAGDFNWGHSKIKGRLRNNRMPPGMPFMMDESNRDGPVVFQGAEVGKEKFEAHFSGDCTIHAVKLLGAWVGAGAPEGEFDFKDHDGDLCRGDFERDVLPLFTEANIWVENSPSCSGCHFASSENSAHELDLSSYAGMMKGADVVSKPPGVSIFGESKVGARDFNWGHSKMKGRLRNNRMPPGMTFMMDQSNRDGPMRTINGQQVRAVKLLGAWAKAGAPETGTFGPYGGTFKKDVLPLFTEPNAWQEGTPACSTCHFASSENSAHELDLTSYAGIRRGADVVSKPPGVSILGAGKPGASDVNWGHSKLKGRMRNNRMPPGMPFMMDQSNRDGPEIKVGRHR